MFDPWSAWDDRIKLSGRPSRVAQELTDVELLNLLACERSGRRDPEKRVLKDELLSRLETTRSPASVEEPHHEAEPDGSERGSATSSSHAIVMRDSMGPHAHSTLPGKPEGPDWSTGL